MKKHRDANDLAARIAAAANQPPVVLTAPEPQSQEASLQNAINERTELRRKDSGRKPTDVDTVPISLRPHRALLNRYINAAAERTREQGRVISAQQIMLEVLESNSV